jgi:hypothetical protein
MHLGIVMDQVVPPSKYGGANRIVAKLCSELVLLGHKVTLYSAPGSYLEGVTCCELPDNFEQLEDSAWLDDSIDLVNLHGPAHILTGKPLLISQQGNGLSYISQHMNFVSRSHANNHGTDCFVYNGLDVNDYPFHQKSDYLVFLAETKWGVKNIRTAISLAEDTKTKLLVMGGDGVDSKYVSYLGMVGEAEGKLDILSKAKGLIYLANWDEPCAVAVLEALACGTPVIATENGCFPELIDEASGFCVRTYKQACSAVGNLSNISPSDCRNRVYQKFSQRKMTEAHIRLYDKILTNTWDYSVPSVGFKSKLRKVYKPTWRNILHYELRHRYENLVYSSYGTDYSYRVNFNNLPTYLSPMNTG